MFLDPISEYITVRPIEEELMTGGSGGVKLHLPSTGKSSKVLQGEVVRVGRGTLTQSGNVVPPQVREGDRVVFHKGRGQEINFNGEDVLFLTERDFLAVVRNEG
jgi:chaperonin GroES